MKTDVVCGKLVKHSGQCNARRSKQEVYEKDLVVLLYQHCPALFADRPLTARADLHVPGNGMRRRLVRPDRSALQHDPVRIGIDQDDTLSVRVAQVKEQFGTMRFYIRGVNEGVRGMIDMAVALSAVILKQ